MFAIDQPQGEYQPQINTPLQKLAGPALAGGKNRQRLRRFSRRGPVV